MDNACAHKKTFLNKIAVILTEVFWYGLLSIGLLYIIAVLRMTDGICATKISVLLFSIKILLIATVVFLLRRLVKSAAMGTPFTFGNVRRLRQIGLIVLLYGPLDMLIKWRVLLKYSDYTITGYISQGNAAGFNLSPVITIMFLGLLILVLAQVFDMGVRLQQDSDLTV